MKKKFYRKILGLSLLALTVGFSIFMSSCQCKDRVYFAVMAGARNEDDCKRLQELIQADKLPDLTYACVGDTITLCWGGNVDKNIIEPASLGIGTVGSAGMKQIVVTQTMTITLKPQNSCASSKAFNVQIVNTETPTTWDAQWAPSPDNSNNRCDHLFFKIPDYFVSKNIQVVKVQAKFKASDATKSPCNDTPFGTLSNSACIFLGCSNMTIGKPFTTVIPSSPPPAVGDWAFSFADRACTRECIPNASLPFELTLLCAKK